VALHDHGGFKWYGKEKIADGPDGRAVGLEAFRDGAYGGRAYANALARAGFVVVVPDAFMWGSRRFALRDEDGAIPTASAGVGDDTEIVRYNAAAKAHEHVVEKYCRLLGTTMAAVIAHEDRVALAYLRSRPDVIAERVGAVGLSGGGLRAGLLQATSDELAAAVVVGMMTTYEDLLDHNVVSHTWMLFPDGLPRVADWPDVVGCRPHSPLLVQYDRDDELFTIDGMRHAHEQLTAGYARAGNPDGYRGQFYDGPHKFDQAMQLAAFSWLHDVLAAG
jgi:dienelactone hydrolase